MYSWLDAELVVGNQGDGRGYSDEQAVGKRCDYVRGFLLLWLAALRRVGRPRGAAAAVAAAPLPSLSPPLSPLLSLLPRRRSARS